MKRKPSEYIEIAIVSILSILIYLYVVHPILEDINPILTFNSSGSGLGPLSMTVTGVILFISYYFIKITIIHVIKPSVEFLIYLPTPFIKFIHSHGIKLFLVNVILLSLFIIPNKYLPERLYPENTDLQGYEEHDE